MRGSSDPPKTRPMFTSARCSLTMVPQPTLARILHCAKFHSPAQSERNQSLVSVRYVYPCKSECVWVVVSFCIKESLQGWTSLGCGNRSTRLAPRGTGAPSESRTPVVFRGGDGGPVVGRIALERFGEGPYRHVSHLRRVFSFCGGLV